MNTDHKPTYENSALPINDRVDDLISQMTLEEKISQTVFDAPAIERLGVPAYNWWNECLHGVGRAGVATVFPQAIGLGATWNPELMQQIGQVISDEARAKHHEAARRGIRQIYTGLTFWSPNVNIFRDPRWGRGQETYGEDPYLTAAMGVSFIKGLQGDDPRYLKLVATAKHYAVHSGPESLRHSFDAQVDERDLRQTYLPHFEACVKEGRVESVMGAYNRTNGEACCASQTLLEKILRQEWGFDGYVVSDCGAIHDIYANHRLVESAEEAAALAVNNGCELNCGQVYTALAGAVEQGLISEETINLALKRLFRARFRLGMFDPPDRVPYADIPYEIINSPAHQALALEAARQSIVLLKNEGDVLPLSKNLESVAVIGPNADEYLSLLGNYQGTPARAMTPLAGIRQQLSPATRLYTAQGCPIADGVLPLQVIPATYLRPVEDTAAEAGLTAAYYDGPSLTGAPAQVRVEAAVNFIWKDTTPLTGEWGDPFAVRWSGFLVPPASGRYRLGVNGFSHYQLYLDEALIVEYQGNHHPILRTKEVELEAGRIYRLQLDFISEGLDPQAQLLWSRPEVDYTAAALEAAAKAEVIIAVMGLSPNLEGEEMPVQVAGFAGGDRTDIRLPRPQEVLLQRLQALGKPMVLVLLNGSALAFNWAAEQIPAIVEAWYPGQAGGQALAEVLFGECNPAGRLPVTFYRSVDDLPPFEDYRMEGRTYRYFRGKPLFPFGHGLSYTRFAYDNLHCEPGAVTVGDQVTISLDVRNSGERAGDEVVQLYLRLLADSARPVIKELKGLKRLGLQPGETRKVTFRLHTHQLGFYDEEMAYAARPGTVEVMVGGSSEDLRLRGHFEIVGQPAEIGGEKRFFSQVEVS